MGRLAREPGLYERLSANAPSSAARFGWGPFINELDGELERLQRLEQRVRRRTERARRLPGRVLGFEEARELLVGDLEPEVGEKLAHEAGILDLLERPGNPEERQVVLPKMPGHAVGVELADCSPGAVLSPRVRAAVGSAVETVLQAIEAGTGEGPSER